MITTSKRVKLVYEEGSFTYNGVAPGANDESIFMLANGIKSIQAEEDAKVRSITVKKLA